MLLLLGAVRRQTKLSKTDSDNLPNTTPFPERTPELYDADKEKKASN